MMMKWYEREINHFQKPNQLKGCSSIRHLLTSNPTQTDLNHALTHITQYVRQYKVGNEGYLDCTQVSSLLEVINRFWLIWIHRQAVVMEQSVEIQGLYQPFNIITLMNGHYLVRYWSHHERQTLAILLKFPLPNSDQNFPFFQLNPSKKHARYTSTIV